MKNDIEYFRKFKIIDFQTNPKKFNQYVGNIILYHMYLI